MIVILCFGTGLCVGTLVRNALLGLALALEKNLSTLGASAGAWSVALWSYVPLVFLFTWLAWEFIRRTPRVSPERKRKFRRAGGIVAFISIAASLVILGWAGIGIVVTAATGPGDPAEMYMIIATTALALLASPCPFLLAGRLKSE